MRIQMFTTTLGTASTAISHALGQVPDAVLFTAITNADGATNLGASVHLRTNPTSASNGITASAGIEGLTVRVAVIRWPIHLQPNFATW